MPIVSSEITGQINKPNGRRKLLMQATDQTGKIWGRRQIVHEASDDVATLAAWVAELDIELPALEVQTEAQNAQQTDVVTPATHQAPEELDKATISLLMQIEDSLEFANTLPWFRTFEIRGGASNNARATYLGVTSQDYGLVTTRYNQITGLVDSLNADALRVWEEGEVW